MAEIKVSAIVSVYKAAAYIEGRLDNLLAQHMYEIGELEIIIVNAGNKQDEDDLIRPYLRRDNVKYIRSLREPIYTSWNRAIRIATGEYITNANCDDRLFPVGLATLVLALSLNETWQVVYSDMTAVAVVGDATQLSNSPAYPPDFTWPQYDPLLLTKQCILGPFPMWRKALHHQYGLFDESYQLAGDYEFWLRLAASGVEINKLEYKAGLFYDGGVGISNRELSANESRRAILQWKDAIYDRYNNSR